MNLISISSGGVSLIQSPPIKKLKYLLFSSLSLTLCVLHVLFGAEQLERAGFVSAPFLKTTIRERSDTEPCSKCAVKSKH